MATATVTKTTTRPSMPPVSTVYRALDGGLHHARCGSRLDFMGGRAGQELDFYCLTCCEHITLTPYVIRRLPDPAAGEVTPARAR